MKSGLKRKIEENDLPKWSKLRIFKNLVLISTSFLLNFTAYDGLSMLQSSMNKKQGVGVLSQAVVYLIFGIASLLLPKYWIKKLGCKTAMFVGMAMYIPYQASNYYPEFYTLIPTAAFLGIGGSLLWGSQCTYFNESCYLYWKLTNQSIMNSSNQKSSPTCTCSKTLSAHQVDSLKNEITVHSSLEYYEVTPPVSSKKVEQTIVTEDMGANLTLVINTVTSNGKDNNTNAVLRSSVSDNEGVCECRNKSDVFSETILNPLHKRTSYGSVTDFKTTDCKKTKDTAKLANLESINAMFFGFHGFVYHSSMCWSNLITYFVFEHGETQANLTIEDSCLCGAQFCNDASCFESETMAEIPSDMKYTLTSIAVVLGILGVLLIYFFVDYLGDKVPNTRFSLEILSASLKHARKKEQLLLIPLSFYVGLEQGFFIGDYTRSFIACSLGTYSVGLVVITYGLTCALTSSLAGLLVKLIGRIPVFLIGLVIDVATCSTLLLWEPSPEQPHMFFVCSALFGVFTGIFWSQVVAFYGVLFKDDQEAAFGFHYLCSSMGATASFAYNDFLCSYVKIYLLLAAVILASTGYITCERIFHLRKKQQS